jgi:hypothetical protein
MKLTLPHTQTSTLDELDEKITKLLKPKRLQKSHFNYSAWDEVEDDEDFGKTTVSYPDFESIVEGEYTFKHYGTIRNPKYSQFIIDAAKDVKLRQPTDHVFLEQINIENGKVDYWFGS